MLGNFNMTASHTLTVGVYGDTYFKQIVGNLVDVVYDPNMSVYLQNNHFKPAATL